MGLPRAQRDDRSLQKATGALDDIPIGHRDADDDRLRGGRWSREEGALTLEQAGKPVQVVVLYDPWVAPA